LLTTEISLCALWNGQVIYCLLHPGVRFKIQFFFHKQFMDIQLKKIISGGQTGADRAALDAAIEAGIPHGGWIPKGRLAEDGPLAGKYNLQEMESGRYRDRTQKNVKEADGTVIFSHGSLTGGSALTEALAIRHDRPLLWLDMEQVDISGAMTALRKWMDEYDIASLNVAGPRSSGDPLIYDKVYAIIHLLCTGA
jgi:hypothetical protein